MKTKNALKQAKLIGGSEANNSNSCLVNLDDDNSGDENETDGSMLLSSMHQSERRQYIYQTNKTQLLRLQRYVKIGKI